MIFENILPDEGGTAAVGARQVAAVNAKYEYKTRTGILITLVIVVTGAAIIGSRGSWPPPVWFSVWSCFTDGTDTATQFYRYFLEQFQAGI